MEKTSFVHYFPDEFPDEKFRLYGFSQEKRLRPDGYDQTIEFSVPIP